MVVGQELSLVWSSLGDRQDTGRRCGGSRSSGFSVSKEELGSSASTGKQLAFLSYGNSGVEGTKAKVVEDEGGRRRVGKGVRKLFYHENRYRQLRSDVPHVPFASLQDAIFPFLPIPGFLFLFKFLITNFFLPPISFCLWPVHLLPFVTVKTRLFCTTPLFDQLDFGLFPFPLSEFQMSVDFTAKFTRSQIPSD